MNALSRYSPGILPIALLILSQPVSGYAQFDPPRITLVINPADKGTTPEEGDSRTYYLNKGLESSVNKGDILNVYREKRPARNVPHTIRLFIGTMVISSTQHGSSMGKFKPNEATIAHPMIKHKTAMKNDIVVPRFVLDSGVLFDPGKIALKPGTKQEFDKVAQFVKNFSPSKLIIEGHTDSDGDSDSNQKLSETRAEAIRKYLVYSYEFITPSMVETRGYGEGRPVVPNDSEVNKTLNRRIEIIVWE